MGFVQRPEKWNDVLDKIIDMGMTDPGFTVIIVTSFE
jgi:hypothetical protein